MAKDTTLLVATVKNEGPNILEWVAHHRLCGFDRIQIYQNDSVDTTLQTLRTLDRLGVIEFHNNRHDKGAHQMRAYRRAARSQAYRDSDWCMVLDGDEFLNVKAGAGGVQDLIAACSGADGIMVNWRVFGSNGHQELTGDLVTERFTRAEASDEICKEMSPFKTLFRTDAFHRPGIHVPRDPKRPDRVMVNGSGLPIEDIARKHWRGLDPEMRRHAQVNHYMLRDLQSFLMKNARGSANAPHRDVGLKYWLQHDRNEEEDLSLADRSREVRAEMRQLDELSGGKLLRLRQRSIRQWRKTVAELTKVPEFDALQSAILDSSSPLDAVPVFRSVRALSDDNLTAQAIAAE
ncbi:MAG: glycosyltransferase family 2 protein [Paracoccaceae bacterium]|nr:glycosyltransferase family 2 protein [Paracoccaceae bacterium]